MKILVINSGSSSIKYQLFDLDQDLILASGLAEKIGEPESRLTHKTTNSEGQPEKLILNEPVPDHQAGLQRIVGLLVDPETGVIRHQNEISAVGHRVVHGGETFHATTIIDDQVLAAIEENVPLAPLHNPPNLMGIRVALSLFPEAPQVAVFDTAFHQTMPPHSFMYALPWELYEQHRVRRYGFHGTSHAYVAEKAAGFLGRPLNDLDLITIHLGNGGSATAIQKGRSIDTSMGMTPLEGLVMGTRCGDVDPALPFFLADHLKMNLPEIDALLNKQSGLKGLCGENDMREVIAHSLNRDSKAQVALDVFAYRIKKYIGAYLAALGALDAVVFTGGIGENAPLIRKMSCQGLGRLGIEIDSVKNEAPGSGARDISRADSEVRILVVPTDEELRIAQETRQAMEKR